MTKLLYADLTYQLRGIGFQVHNELGPGHDEKDYEVALCYGMSDADIIFRPQQKYYINYRDEQIGEYIPDIVLADGKVIRIKGDCPNCGIPQGTGSLLYSSNRYRVGVDHEFR